MPDIYVFMKAQEKAEDAGKYEFVCPLCGGKAWWERKLLHSKLVGGCRDCGMNLEEYEAWMI